MGDVRLEFHVPEPRSRPGEPVSFSHLAIPSVDVARRPDACAPAHSLRELPYELIRVLDESGRAGGQWNPTVSADHLRAGLRAMLLTRIFDDRMFRAQRQGKTTFYITSRGEEAIGAAQSLALGRHDMCFPTYRTLSWLMARRYPLINLINQIYNNVNDPLKGRQLPVLYSAREYGFYSLSGNVGTRIGHAVGWSMASAFKGDSKIALGYIGEGTTAEGDFHEALTFAAVYRVPVILCVVNNQWAISSFDGVAGGQQTTFAAKALGYGIAGLRVDGNDFLALHAATEWAVNRARANCGPTLMELVTYRAGAHSTSDDPGKYRSAQEPRAWPLGDPIQRLQQHLLSIGEWDDARHEQLTQELTVAVREAAKQGEAIGTFGRSKPNVREMFEDVYKEPDWRLLEQLGELDA